VFNPPNTEQIQAVVIFIYKITILGDKGWLSFRTPANNHPENLCFPSQQTLLTQPTRHSKKLPSLDSSIPGHKLLSPDKRTSRDQSKTWLCFGCSASGFQLD